MDRLSKISVPAYYCAPSSNDCFYAQEDEPFNPDEAGFNEDID